MILKLDDVKNACTKILTAIDNSSESNLKGMVELKTLDNILFLNITNNEYFVKVKLAKCDEVFHATVKADTFLKLIAQFSTEDIEFNITENNLIIKADGNYKLPLIYDMDHVLDLPEIVLSNISVNFDIDGVILDSILKNNSKELLKIPKAKIATINPLQKMYYIDENGAITFTTGACVNKFTLEKPVKLLLNGNLVKLFSLFKNVPVKFAMGHEAVSDELIYTKVKFETDDICITAILNSDESLVQKMPAEAVRNMAFTEYPYVITMEKDLLLKAIKRLITLNSTDSSNKIWGKFSFNKAACVISDYSKENIETIKYIKEFSNDFTYDTMFDLIDFKLALETNSDQYITLSFGNNQALVIAKDNIYSVIPEARTK